jgi:hypothetical protein
MSAFVPYVDGSLHFRGDYGLALAVGRSVAIGGAEARMTTRMHGANGYLRVKAIIHFTK